jgi:multicomponent Na+:H+ antiporter subunit C
VSAGEVVSFLIFFIGLYGLIAKKNIVKSIISLEVMETAVILYFISCGFKAGALPPIGDVSPHLMADPLPQALMITAIVIGVSSTAIALTMYIHLYRKYGTENWEEAMKKRVK